MENENEMEAKFHIIPAINNNDYEIIFKNPQIMSQIKRFIFNAIFICAFYLSIIYDETHGILINSVW